MQRNDVHLHPYGKSHMLNMGDILKSGVGMSGHL